MATGKYGSASGLLLLDGYNLLASKLQSMSFEPEALMEPSHGIGDSWEESTPTGMSRAVVEQLGAFWDTTALYSHAALKDGPPGTPQATARIACMGFAGQTKGQPFHGFEGAHQMTYGAKVAVGKLTRADARFVISGRADHDGVILQELAAQTADWNTEGSSVDHTTEVTARPIPITSSSVANPSVITTAKPHGLASGDTVLIAGHAGSTPDINGEQTVTVVSTTTFTIPVNVTVGGTGGTLVYGETNAGGAGYLQVNALSLGTHTGLTIKVRHSVDNAAWADLLTLCTSITTAPAAYRVTVTGEVRRYLAITADFEGAGSPSATVFAGFARF